MYVKNYVLYKVSIGGFYYYRSGQQNICSSNYLSSSLLILTQSFYFYNNKRLELETFLGMINVQLRSSLRYILSLQARMIKITGLNILESMKTQKSAEFHKGELQVFYSGEFETFKQKSFGSVITINQSSLATTR